MSKSRLKIDSAGTVYERIRTIGFEPYPITLDEGIKDVKVPRAFVSNLFGGNPQKTFPEVASERVQQHGYDNFMMLNCNYNPEAPKYPGSPGLFYSPRAETRPEQRVFVGIKPKEFGYKGQYELVEVDSLTSDEFTSQSNAFKRTWAKGIMDNKWGREIRTRIILRRRLHREPTKREFEKAMEAGFTHQDLTESEIENAYVVGQEKIFLYALKCVGYDEGFQRTIADAYTPDWTPPAKAKGVKRAKRKDSKMDQKAKGAAHVSRLRRATAGRRPRR
ncbi:hypothetical protein JAAARDRAFT_184640 [Jaapia argillacea MUCL 33604]|uniref:DUF6697 domain-containing protein n=1 Tax=Jaapia argillacea MUCL 33604 TaxID=933084 RepID=A0A067PBC3_9AGAM|nr:hypothetical protein JAAARDRAFT_184640 [Jaapia argillacea MUCL 33604]